MYDDVNKQRYQSRAVACIYLWIWVVRTIRQMTSEAAAAVTVLAYWNIYFARWRQFAPVGGEVRKPTTLDLTQTLRAACVRVQRGNFCSNRRALHFLVRSASEHARYTLKAARLRLWQVAGEGER